MEAFFCTGIAYSASPVKFAALKKDNVALKRHSTITLSVRICRRECLLKVFDFASNRNLVIAIRKHWPCAFFKQQARIQ